MGVSVVQEPPEYVYFWLATTTFPSVSQTKRPIASPEVKDIEKVLFPELSDNEDYDALVRPFSSH